MRGQRVGEASHPGPPAKSTHEPVSEVVSCFVAVLKDLKRKFQEPAESDSDYFSATESAPSDSEAGSACNLQWLASSGKCVGGMCTCQVSSGNEECDGNTATLFSCFARRNCFARPSRPLGIAQAGSSEVGQESRGNGCLVFMPNSMPCSRRRRVGTKRAKEAAKSRLSGLGDLAVHNPFYFAMNSVTSSQAMQKRALNSVCGFVHVCNP